MDSARSCHAVASALQLGQSITQLSGIRDVSKCEHRAEPEFLRVYDRRANHVVPCADAVPGHGDSGRECASIAPCGCARVASPCIPGGCSQRAITLHERLSTAQHVGTAQCNEDAQCNSAANTKNRCLAGRCSCAWPWATHNCSFRNDKADASEKLAYAEDRYSQYYANVENHYRGTKLDSPLAKASDSDLPILSGPGSRSEATVGIRTVLPTLLTLLKARSIIDCPVGDFNYMRGVLSDPETPAVNYVGLDIVSNLTRQLQRRFGGHHPRPQGSHTIRFRRFDVSRQFLWPADVVIMRDILFHFGPPRAKQVLNRVYNSSGCRYLLATTFPSHRNEDAFHKFHTGRGYASFASWNLQDAPFNLPPPILSIAKDGERFWKTHETNGGRVVGVWPCRAHE